MHDPTAVIACLKPELLTMEEYALSVVTEGKKIGLLERHPDGAGRKCFVCMDVDIDAVIDEYKTTISLNP